MGSKYIKTFNPRNVYIPTFLSNQELMQLILEATDGFLFIVNCHCGRITFTSESIINLLNCNKKEWIGASIYDKVHVDDIENVKLQLSIKLPTKAFWFSDARTEFWKKEELTDCLKRDFICRMKTGNYESKKRKRDNYIFQSRDSPHYVIVRCNGFIKKEPPNGQIYYTSSFYSQKDDTTSAYLVATGRLELYSLPYSISTLSLKLEFTTRLNVHGIYVFVDDQVRNMLPYYAKDLLGRNFQSFCHPLDRALMCECFKQSLNFKGQHMTILCRFKTKENEWVSTRATMYGFINHWSSADEFIVCTYSLVNQAITSNDYYFPTILQDDQISSTYQQTSFPPVSQIEYNQIPEFEPISPSKIYDPINQRNFCDIEPIFANQVNFSDNSQAILENQSNNSTIDLSNTLPSNNNWSWNSTLDETEVEEDLKILNSSKSLLKSEIENHSQELTDILSVLKAENSSVFVNVFNEASTTINDGDLVDFQSCSNKVG